MQSLTTFKGLISGYNRDLQEDKPPLWEALEVAESTALVLAETMEAATLKPERMRYMVGQNFATATELANYLVQEKGLAFRTCHEIIGSLVGTLVAEGETLDNHARVQQLLAAAGQELELEEIAGVVDPEACLRLQVSLGSTGPAEVSRMLERLRGLTEEMLAAVVRRDQALAEARTRTAALVQAVLEGESVSALDM
jgi:argininosuccinate lyase